MNRNIQKCRLPHYFN